jgi:hypothetical protein
MKEVGRAGICASMTGAQSFRYSSPPHSPQDAAIDLVLELLELSHGSALVALKLA